MSDKLVANLRHVGGLADTLAGLRVVVFDEVDLILTHRVWVCRQTPRRGSSRDCLAVELTRRDRQTAGGPSKATASNMPRPYGGPARHRRMRETACPFPPQLKSKLGALYGLLPPVDQRQTLLFSVSIPTGFVWDSSPLSQTSSFCWCFFFGSMEVAQILNFTRNAYIGYKYILFQSTWAPM